MQRAAEDHVQSILSDAVSEFARTTRFAVAFGGLERAGDAIVTAVSGLEHGSLEGLLVRGDRGLGGRALREGRPRIAVNYVRSRQITHEYDAYVVDEGIIGLFAVPVLVDGAARAVLYGGTREPEMPGNGFVRAAGGIVRDLAHELRVEFEVARRLEARRSETESHRSPAQLPAPAIEVLRNVHAGVRGALAEASSPALSGRLSGIERWLTELSAPSALSSSTAEAARPVRLSPREIDTLAQVALGATNAEIGVCLGLTENTVKSYLNAAMTKLDASTRHAAVSRARALGLLV